MRAARVFAAPPFLACTAIAAPLCFPSIPEATKTVFACLALTLRGWAFLQAPHAGTLHVERLTDGKQVCPVSQPSQCSMNERIRDLDMQSSCSLFLAVAAADSLCVCVVFVQLAEPCNITDVFCIDW